MPDQPMTLLTIVLASKFLDMELVHFETTYPDGHVQHEWKLLPYHTTPRLEDFQWKEYELPDKPD